MIIQNIDHLCIDRAGTIADAARIIHGNAAKIALVLDDQGGLLGTVTDALIRTALLSGKAMTDPLKYCMYETPDFDFVDQQEQHYHAMMKKHVIRQLPLLDGENRLCALAVLEPEWRQDHNHPLVVIMAGGLGTRLSPLTNTMPKPMVDLCGAPLVEKMIVRFRECGFREFALSVNFLAEVIENYFGDGTRWGISISYIRENKRMGTAGSLGLLDVDDSRPVFVTNGDILTALDYGSMMTLHLRRGADATIAVNSYSEQLLYGVVTVEHNKVAKIEEKPVINFLANSGNYIIQGAALKFLPSNEFFDMPDLLNLLVQHGNQVIPYPLYEYWQDIGNLRDLERARKNHETVFAHLAIV